MREIEGFLRCRVIFATLFGITRASFTIPKYFASLETRGVCFHLREQRLKARETLFSGRKADLVRALRLHSSAAERHMGIGIIRNVLILDLKLYERRQPLGAKHYEV